MNNQHTRPIGCSPEKFALARFSPYAAPEDSVIYTKSLQDLRQLRDMAEAIGDIANAHRLSKFGGPLQPHLQVTNQRLSADKKLVGLNKPRAHIDAPGARILFKPFFLLRLHFQVIIEHNCLTVEHEIREIAIAVQDIEQLIDRMDKPCAKLLEGQIPFTIPVCMWNKNNVELLGHDAPW